MTTVLFAHDGYILSTNEGIYSDAYNNKIVERYFNIADNVVFLVRTRPSDSQYQMLNKINVKNFNIESVENFKTLKGILKYHAVIDIVKQKVQKSDYIIARIPSDLGYLAALYAKFYKKRYLVEVVGCPWDSYNNHSICGKLIAPYYYLIQKKIVKRAPYAVYVTNEFLQSRYPCMGKSISCSDVEIENMDEAVLARRIKKIKASDMNQLVFGTLGPLNMKYKGYDTVIKAIAKLNSEGYSYKYCIVGSGDPSWLSSIIHKYYANSFVKILPSMPHKKVFEWLDSIDIYVQPSKTEGMPRALIEAMSMGVPSIGSNIGGIPELLGNLLIFKRSSAKGLSKCILNITKDELERTGKENFYKATKYTNTILEKRRTDFYKLFTFDESSQ